MRKASHIIREIFKKEVIDILRDRRALMVMMVLPVFLYPALFGGLTWIQKRQAKQLSEKTVTVQFRNAEQVPPVVESLREMPAIKEVERDDPEGAVAEGKLDLLLELEPVGIGGKRAKVTVYFNSDQDTSQEGLRRLNERMREMSNAVNAVLLEMSGGLEVPLPDNVPAYVVAAVPENVGKGGGVLGRMLAMMLVIMSVSGAMYPALDLGAGEKERGTMETILAAPVKRHQIVFGKYLATSAIAGVTALVNLVVMALTFKWMADQAAGSAAVGELSFDLETMLVVLLVLAPLVLLFSAAALALSTFARSYKEAQSYVTPLMIVGMVPAMVAIAPGIKLGLWTGLTPVLSTVLLFRDQMAGLAGFGDTALVFGSTCVYALVALLWAVQIYKREEVLFRA